MYEELIECLKVMNEQDAAEVLRHVRAGMEIASILSHIQDGNLLLQLSLLPETRRRYEFPYVSGMPSHLFVADNPYLDSLLYQATLSEPITRNNSDLVPREQHTHSNSRQRATYTTSYHVTYLMPYHAAQMVEPIVEKLTAAPWTRVISDDGLLRRLIRSYFYYPHPCGPFVHKDLFLEDMATGGTCFCSPLLVNAILSIASQSCLDIPNRSKMWLPDSLTYRSMAEARRLWDLESFGKSRITTIQAALILSYSTTNNGMDEIGTMYLRRACEMGRDLDLFGPNNTGKGIKMDKARIFTAWAIFSWQALFNFSFFRPPDFEQPPQVPLPDAKVEPRWYGEIWIQYPHDQTLNPLHVGHKLQTEAALHAIMNNMGLISFGGSGSWSITRNEIIVLKRKLDVWKETLPEPLQPKKLVFPLHLTLHVQYYQLVVAFMQLIINFKHLDDPEVLNLCGGKTPLVVLHEARMMLETVMRLYYARHNFELYDPWIAFALTAIGNTIIADLATGSSSDRHLLDGYRSTLILSAQGLNKQSLNYHMSTLLAIQLEKAMEPKDLQLVQTHGTAAGINEDDQVLIAEHLHSQWPIPRMTAINEDPERPG